MQVGGPAQYFAEPTCEEELVEAIEFARHEKIPFIILGKGSNVIFPDEGYPGLVITLIHYEDNRIVFDPERPSVTASGGVHLYRFTLACRDAGLGGAEFLANIPGTVGGALVMNAGFSRFPGQSNEIGDIVEDVTVMDPEGKKERLTRNGLTFSYRRSNLDGRIVLEAKFSLWRRAYGQIEKEIRANFDYRNQKQDLRYPSSGSIFKNPPPPHPSAGQLIERMGLKGAVVGGAMVSTKHGNYIINVGRAKSSDVSALIQKIQQAVLDATEIFLEREVRIIEKP
jgi:UDP-N-acetylmuramate dehydrogenase